jgi:hypothetical protein
MRKTMNAEDRYRDIALKSGYSPEIVRAILRGTRESIYDSVGRGEQAIVPGICRVIPGTKIKFRGNEGIEVSTVRCSATAGLRTMIEKVPTSLIDETFYVSNEVLEEQIVGLM